MQTYGAAPMPFRLLRKTLGRFANTSEHCPCYTPDQIPESIGQEVGELSHAHSPGRRDLTTQSHRRNQFRPRRHRLLAFCPHPAFLYLSARLSLLTSYAPLYPDHLT